MDYLGEWGGGGPGHSWAQMAWLAADRNLRERGLALLIESWYYYTTLVPNLRVLLLFKVTG
jgi:hypothetical protein